MLYPAEKNSALILSERGILDERYGDRLSRLRAVVLLAGSVRANQLRKATGRCPLEMPVGNHRSVLDCWREQLVSMAERLGVERLPVRVMVDRGCGMRTGVRQYGPVQMSIETDPSDLRGTGGLLSDLAREYSDDDLILVTHASQLLFEPLAELADSLARSQSDVAMICNQAGEPAGLTMLRCGCLRNINNVGFVDLNEQALPEIAECHEVRVVRYDRPVAHPLRTLNQYLSTLRTYHRRESGRLTDIDPYLEDWQASFEIIENGAAVHEDSVVHDSVILAGARIEAGATLVRCLVCPGSVVTKGKSVVDQVISSRVQHV